MTKSIVLLFVTGLLFIALDAKGLENNVKQIRKPSPKSVFFDLKKGVIFDNDTFKNQLNRYFYLSDKNAFHIESKRLTSAKSKKGKNLNDEIIRMNRTYDGIPVEGDEVIVHLYDKEIRKIIGADFQPLDISTKPKISPSKALQIAIDEINAEKYMWEGLSDERPKKQGIKRKTPFYPKADLVITTNETKNEQLLCYKVNVLTRVPYGGDYVYVDANSGGIVKKISSVYHAIEGTGNTLYDGEQTIFTTKPSPSEDYELYNDNTNIETTTNIVGERLTDSDNVWNDEDQEPFVSAYWAGHMTHEYFLNNFGLNSFDGNGSGVIIQVIPEEYENGAGWLGPFSDLNDRGMISISRYPETDYPASLDVIGHEWTHGVTKLSADLAYVDEESGALNESFSDIFGTMVEFSARDGGGNYWQGEDFWIEDGKARNMANPKEKEDPDTYLGEYWHPGNCSDKICEGEYLHTNSGVGNYWFYLLAEGGIGVNDNNDEYAVSGISREKAAVIAYRTLTHYLASSSGYGDARYFSIESATDLFLENSYEVAQVTNAWYAVGVGGAFEGAWVNYHLVPTILTPLILN